MEMVEEGKNQPKIAAKRIKFEEIAEEEEEGGEDRISLLPDCLLVEIVSRLDSTKEAIRTGTLSNRWKHIWTSVPVVIFSSSDCNWPPFDFVSCFDKMLTQRRQLKLKIFKLSSGFCSRQQINSWIRYAIRCNVEQLDLWYPENSIGRDGFDEFFFTSSCFTDLRISSCAWKPSGAISWKNLRSLSIYEGEFDQDLIENILSGSPLLETLVLECCHGFRRLDITSKSLKKFVFSGYGPFDYDEDLGPDEILEINAPNILSLTIDENLGLRNLFLLNVSSLIEANLYYIVWNMKRRHRQEMLKRLILNLSHAKVLRIACSRLRDVSRLKAKGFAFPSNIMFHGEIESASETEDSEFHGEIESASETESDSE